MDCYAKMKGAWYWVDVKDYRMEYPEVGDPEGTEVTMHGYAHPLLIETVPLIRHKKVVYNEPMTYVQWDDGTETMVRCKGEYDPVKELALCYMKRVTGNA